MTQSNEKRLPPAATDSENSVALVDDRGASRGWGRAVPALFWIAGVATLGYAVWELIATNGRLGPGLVVLLAGLLYTGTAVGISHNGRRMRILAWSCIAVSLGGPIIQGLLELGISTDNSAWSPWAYFGRESWFASIWLPILGAIWLWWSNPNRIVELSS